MANLDAVIQVGPVNGEATRFERNQRPAIDIGRSVEYLAEERESEIRR